MAKWTKQRAVEYANDYIKEKYDRVNLTIPKGKKELYTKYAKANGISLNAFINQLLEEYVLNHGL